MCGSMHCTLVVLAAGLGSRYGGLKQMEGFGPHGETLLEYNLYDAWLAGIRRVVFIIRRSMEQDFRDRVLTRLPAALQVELCFQEMDALPPEAIYAQDRVKPWGTGHAIWVAKDRLDGPFVVVNGDDFYGRDGFVQLTRFFAETGGETHAMVAYPLGKTLSAEGGVSRGICEVDPDGWLLSIREVGGIERVDGKLRSAVETSVKLDERTPTSMNLFGFSRSILARIDRDFRKFLEQHGAEMKSEFFLPSVVNELISDQPCAMRVLCSDSDWMGVTHPSDRDPVVAGIAQKVRQGLYPQKLWAELR